MSYAELKQIREGALSQAIDIVNRAERDACLEGGDDSSLEATWFALDSEPGMDDIYSKAGTSLQPMIDKLGIKPFKTRDGEYRLFLTQYKVLKNPGTAAGLNVNFLGGAPIECTEMLILIGEHSSLPGLVEVMQGDDKKSPPKPDKLFSWPDTDRVLFNKMWKRTKLPGLQTNFFADSLGDEKPEKHFWFNANFYEAGELKFPIPGEFCALGVRIMPDRPWGKQETSPFLYAGNWIDTIYYTGGLVTDIIEPSSDTPYPKYKVQWRGQELEAMPSDFTPYQVGDRVTILKDIATEKEVQTWKDDDTKTAAINWVIVPVTFYDEVST